MFGRRKTPGRFRRFSIVSCGCPRCYGPQQILRIKEDEKGPLYKVAYYNALFGGRHWVRGNRLAYYR